ncbi:MAG: Kae1-associated serine/threonine protein kinase [Nanoarchaeota archaeon]|nr:Kae1-associated serine/threonine protein kinase [Nanoarchaeota archaeon]
MEIGRGAEAILILNNNLLIKNRVEKCYRLKEIDEKLRKERTKKEAKLLSDAKRAGVKTPTVFNTTKTSIEMEFVEGKLLRDHINKARNWEMICKKIGENIAKLHENNIIHGDLTTSNMILKNEDVYFIDFGLGYESKRIEDKAIDLRVLEKTLKAKHCKRSDEFFKKIIKSYTTYEKSNEVINRLEKIQVRGRYL